MQRLVFFTDALFFVALLWIAANMVHFIFFSAKGVAGNGFFCLSNALSKMSNKNGDTK